MKMEQVIISCDIFYGTEVVVTNIICMFSIHHSYNTVLADQCKLILWGLGYEV